MRTGDGAPDAGVARAGERGGPERRGDIGLRLVGALTWYWFLRARLQEGQAWIERVLAAAAAPGVERTAARAWALNGAGWIAVARGVGQDPAASGASDHPAGSR